MSIERKTYGTLKCLYSRFEESDKVMYVLYPMDTLGSWIEDASGRYRTNIVVITGMDWDNDLTPWQAPGVPAGSPPFQGNAPGFLKKLTDNVIPEIEKDMGLHNTPPRTLVGVSLSGLFALWQWSLSSFFDNIATLSGSFWYKDFVEWIYTQSFTQKNGRCFMLLGNAEPHSGNPIFATVGKCTEDIVGYLRRQGVSVDFRMVEGNHYQYPIRRLDMVLGELSGVK